MTPTVIASSPLVGPGAMAGVAEHLRGIGRDVALPDVPFDLDAFAASVGAACACAAGRPVLVGYSAAGPRLFHVVAHVDVAAVVFLDARLPADGVAPDSEPRFAELLDALPLADDGTLPPWPEWWPPDVIADMIPDPVTRSTLMAACGRPPRNMFSQPIPAPDTAVPCGFVGLGDGYAADASEARRRGWPVDIVDGAHHLWPVVRPDAVGNAIAAMADRLAP